MDQYWDAYSYCGADPVNTVDEWGLEGEDKGYTPNPGHPDNPEGPWSISSDDPGLGGWSMPVTPTETGPNRTIVSNGNGDDGPPTITSSYDNGFKDHNKDGKIDEKDINQWFDEHDIPEEVFKKIIWKLQEDDHYVFALLVINAKKALDIYKTVRKGRTGKQAKLKKLADDPNVSSADRGWINQEKNAIARKSKNKEGNVKKHVRNPPGKDLAHERGREAAKGFGYEHSNLQDNDLHDLQHKYDDYGKKNTIRPDNK